MWNETIALTGFEVKYIDDVEEVTKETTKKNIPASFKSVRSGEFYAANSNGIKADVVIEIMGANYSGEKYAVDERTGKKYEVIRTYTTRNGERIELTCSNLSTKGAKKK